ncbi:MAG: DnaJ domain-containing protein [Desulfobacterales bacterium]|nr:DnaJ domain-containing protein [Desulfobacterales bacterium]MDX2510482.1 DnaJ domain-containing protein [Desulfobacterales bacterium]
MDLKNCYKILEIQETASLSEIKHAYRDMIGIWHPDRYVQNPRLHEKATEKLKELNVAYNELRNRLTSGIVNRDVKPSSSKNDAHLIIVRCPGCQKKNRIKAGFVKRHPRCGACGILLFHKKQTHTTGPSASMPNEKPSSRKKGFQEAPAPRNPFLKKKRRFWNKWTLLLLAAGIGLAIASSGGIRHRLTKQIEQISGGLYNDYFKTPALTYQTENSMAAPSTVILQIQQDLQELGYDTGPLDGTWGEHTLAAVRQFRTDYFLVFRVEDATETTKALQRQHSIAKLYPDWFEIVKSDRFKWWIEQQVMTSPEICREILASGEVRQVRSLLDWYQFDHLQPKPVPMPRNGTLKKGYSKGLAPLTIQTRNDGRHYYLKLLNTLNGSETLSAFIRAGSVFVEHVPVGKYELKYAVGESWYGIRWLFGPKTVFRKMDQVFEFKIQSNEVSGYKLDLYLRPISTADVRKNFAFDF